MAKRHLIGFLHARLKFKVGPPVHSTEDWARLRSCVGCGALIRGSRMNEWGGMDMRVALVAFAGGKFESIGSGILVGIFRVPAVTAPICILHVQRAKSHTCSE